MLTHMIPLRKEIFAAHGKEYELLLFKVEETGELRLFVSTGGFGVGPTFSASRDVVANMMYEKGKSVGQELINQAMDEIERNELKQY